MVVCPVSPAALTHKQRIDKINQENKKNESDSNKSIQYREMKYYEPVSSPKEILEELKNVLEQERCKDENSISLWDVLTLSRIKYEECNLADHKLCWRIKDMLGESVSIYSSDYDTENKQLIIRSNGRIYFTKQNGELFIVKSESYDANNILAKCGDEISKRYDKFIEDISFYRDYMKNIESSNSTFKISSSEYSIYISNSLKNESDFELSAKIFEDKFDYNCNSNDITSICRNNEIELFKRVFVKIEDCPEWMRSKLYEIRQAQLIEEQKIEEKLQKKQRRLEMIKKLNPFRKN